MRRSPQRSEDLTESRAQHRACDGSLSPGCGRVVLSEALRVFDGAAEEEHVAVGGWKRGTRTRSVWEEAEGVRGLRSWTRRCGAGRGRPRWRRWWRRAEAEAVQTRDARPDGDPTLSEKHRVAAAQAALRPPGACSTRRRAAPFARPLRPRAPTLSLTAPPRRPVSLLAPLCR